MTQVWEKSLMSTADSVTRWIDQLKAGDEAAAERLWDRYFHRLVGLARKKLQATARTAADEEDVALSAFASFCRAAQKGRFPRLSDRDDLWAMLMVITARKAGHLVRHENQEKRARAPTDQDGARPALASGEGVSDLEAIIGREPTPAFAAQVAEQCRRLLASLGDADLERIALLKMEGYSQGEIAAQLGCVERTVRRRLHRIRTIWEKETTE
jgi:RNA polymerase sigma factor (sigma-70 family)